MTTTSIDWKKTFNRATEKKRTRTDFQDLFFKEKSRLEGLTSTRFFFLNHDVLKTETELRDFFGWLTQAIVPNRKKLPENTIINVLGLNSVDLFIPSLGDDLTNRNTSLSFQKFTDEDSTLVRIERMKKIVAPQQNTTQVERT